MAVESNVDLDLVDLDLVAANEAFGVVEGDGHKMMMAMRLQLIWIEIRVMGLLTTLTIIFSPVKIYIIFTGNVYFCAM